MEKEILKLQEMVDEFIARHPTRLNVLEAGSGDMSYIHFGEKAHITGIDISELQLARHQGLDEKVLGDLEVYDFPPSSFDIIICWNVLEHLQNPSAALTRFAAAVRQRGIIILGMPNGLSLKGLLAKHTPHIFHIWIYRYIFGLVNAGQADQAPFRTILSPSILPSAIQYFAQEQQLRVIYYASYDRAFFKRGLGRPFHAVKRLVQWMSLGKIGDSDFIIVLQKA